MLVINSSYSAHSLKRRRPLLLHFPTPSVPITPSQVWWFFVHSGIKVHDEDEFVWPGCCRNYRIQGIIELVFNLSWVGHCGCTYKNCCLLPDKGSLSFTRRPFMPFENPESLLTRCDLMANPTPASRPPFLHSIQKKVQPVPTSSMCPSSARRVSLRAAISTLYSSSSLPTRAVIR